MMPNPKYLKLAAELAALLRLLDIPFELIPTYDGVKIDFEWCGADAITHSGAYGGPEGFFETMGFVEDGDDVRGYLTTAQVLESVLHAWNQMEKEEQ